MTFQSLDQILLMKACPNDIYIRDPFVQRKNKKKNGMLSPTFGL